MGQHKPLSYESLKSVIQYMDSNFRLVRSRQIASLRNIQKVVPLKLGVLKLENTTLTFDYVRYNYNHCRELIRDGGPVTTLNTRYDFNRDGHEEIFHDLMPGDIVIKDRHWRGETTRCENFISDSFVLWSIRTGLDEPNRRAKSQYGMKLRDMMRKTLYEVLGGKGIHQVEHLKIGVHNGVLRLPEGLKLKIRELSIAKNNMAVIDAILPILDLSSFPLKSLSITLDDQQDPVIQSEILRSSELLNIKIEEYFGNSWANLLINVPNMKIHLKNEISLDDIVLIIRNWMEHPRVIGTRLSMQAESIEEYSDKIEKEFKAISAILPERECILAFPCFTLPMTSTSELNIYGAKSPNREEGLNFESWNPYMIVMEVMTIGTAKLLKHQ